MKNLEGYIRGDELSVKRRMALIALEKAKEMEANQKNRVTKYLIVDGKPTTVTFTGDNIEQKFQHFVDDVKNNFTTFKLQNQIDTV